MEWKQACPEQQHSRKAHHPGPLMNAIGQKKHSSTTLPNKRWEFWIIGIGYLEIYLLSFLYFIN
jgi:hypothetical protein